MHFRLFMTQVGVKFIVGYCEVPGVNMGVARCRARRGRARCSSGCS
jgi:hypothetical protein